MRRIVFIVNGVMIVLAVDDKMLYCIGTEYMCVACVCAGQFNKASTSIHVIITPSHAW